MFAASDRALAKALKVDRKSLTAWRQDPGLAQYVPKPTAQGHDVAQWRVFIAEHSRRPASKMDVGKVLASSKAMGHRRQMLFNAFDQLHDAEAEGHISRDEYHRAGDLMIGTILDLGRLLNAGIDEKGFRDLWDSIKEEGRQV